MQLLSRQIRSVSTARQQYGVHFLPNISLRNISIIEFNETVQGEIFLPRSEIDDERSR